MVYKFTETNKANDEFTKVFGIGFKPFYDGLVSVATKQLWIDVLKFDEWLQKKHGNYEDEGKSMNDVIREHYGDKGVKLVNALTGEDDDEGPKSDKREDNIKETNPQEIMEPKKVNERIAMAMLRQCALVWECCAVLPKHVTECELKFADVLKSMGKNAHKTETGHIMFYVDYNRLWHANEPNPIKGVYIDVKYEFAQLEVEGFKCSYRLEDIFGVTRDFCQMNACQSLMNKTVFGMDSSGRYARLPTQKAQKKPNGKTKTKVKVTHEDVKVIHEPTLAERLREALLQQFAKAA